jgi:hypothetical protein
LQGEELRRIIKAVPTNAQLEFVQTDPSCSSENGEADEDAAVETILARDGISSVLKELLDVTGYLRTKTSKEDMYERSFLKEGQVTAQEERNSLSVNEAQITIDKESLLCQVEASTEQKDDLSPKGPCMSVQPAVTERSRHTVELQEILEQCKNAAALKKLLVIVIQERDAHSLEAEQNAAITENVEKRGEPEVANLRAQYDAQKLELANLKAQYQEDISLLNDQMRILKTQRDHFIEGQDVLAQRVQCISDDLETVKRTRDFLGLELENWRAQYEQDVSLLRSQLHFARTQCLHFIDERELLLMRVQRIGAELEVLKRKPVNRQGHCKDCRLLENKLKRTKAEISEITKERNRYIFLAQKAIKSRKAIEKERDALKHENFRCNCNDAAFPEECKDIVLLEKKLNDVTAEREKIKTERDRYILRARSSRGIIDAMKKGKDALIRDNQELQRKCKGVDNIKERLNAVRNRCGELGKGNKRLVRRINTLLLENEELRRQVEDARAQEIQLDPCNEMKRETDAFMLDAQRKARNIDATGQEGKREAEGRASWYPCWPTVRRS